MSYLKADARAELLIDATRILIEKEGYAAVTARKIAQASGAAIGHINRHFTSLNQLKCQAFLAIVNEKVLEHQAASAAREGIESVLALLIKPDKEQHKIELWREISILSQQDKELHEIFVYALRLWHRSVSNTIERGMRQKLLRCHDTAAATAWRLIAQTLGQDSLAMHGMLNGEPDIVESNLLHMIRLELQPTTDIL
ncbi:TetR family transcriptional regulator [Mixta intestinalis]|jgi:AcrR family transcriptional regulator|uniref:HTH tetR-type domain-containing protein n=1 Tax=Mixta intestinalis TaxID=1615494 RepID=A0A6P1Q2Z8_9GAMM|nr:TetR family transcriptional regulator [Mixta intestinalis]QHM72722.1 hypothetical protein C7M51_03040 [Mixta intestinalis]